jgi:hypothetical protein
MLLALLILEVTQPLDLLALLRLVHLPELCILQPPEQPFNLKLRLPLKSPLFHVPALRPNNVRISPASVRQVSRERLAYPILSQQQSLTYMRNGLQTPSRCFSRAWETDYAARLGSDSRASGSLHLS